MKTLRYILLVSLFLFISNRTNALIITATNSIDRIETVQWKLTDSAFTYNLISDTQVASTYNPGIGSNLFDTLNMDILDFGNDINTVNNVQSINGSFQIHRDQDIPLYGITVNELNATGLLKVVIDENPLLPQCPFNPLELKIPTPCENYNSSTPVPEPDTMLLLGTGFLGLVFFGRWRMKK